jgi:hypothetical protein
MLLVLGLGVDRLRTVRLTQPLPKAKFMDKNEKKKSAAEKVKDRTNSIKRQVSGIGRAATGGVNGAVIQFDGHEAGTHHYAPESFKQVPRSVEYSSV